MRENILSGYSFEDTYGYSRAVKVGNQVFVSGTTARGADLEGDAYVQASAALAIISDVLSQAEASLADVVRTVVYIRDTADIEFVARAHRESFADIRPAATIVAVSGLTPDDVRVEIEVTAVIGA